MSFKGETWRMEEFFRAACEAGPVLRLPWLPGRCAFLELCLWREKALLLWIPYPALGERPCPCWTYGWCPSSWLPHPKSTRTVYPVCCYRKLRSGHFRNSVILTYFWVCRILGYYFCLFFLFKKKPKTFSFVLLGSDGCGGRKWTWDQWLLPFTENC